MNKVIIDQIKKKIDTRLTNRRYIDVAFNRAEKKFAVEKATLIRDFDSHEITKEVKGGATYEESILERGNLFSFLGFAQSEQPIDPIKELLIEGTYLKKSSLGAKYTKDKVIYEFPVRFPSLDEIYNVSPMPWQGGKSWVWAVENGISNFSQYVYHKFFASPDPSRSSTGLQDKRRNMSGGYQPRPYLTQILQNFRKKFK